MNDVPLPVRLFLALDLPDSLRDALAALRSEIPGARWVPPENLHVTLHFLGDAAPDRATALAADVQTLAFSPVPLVPDGLDVFPNLRRPNVLVVRLETNAAFSALHAEAAALVRRHGFVPEARPFRPHATVARLKRPDLAALRAFAESPVSLPSATATRVTLYESRLTARGAQYQRLSGASAR